jgi:hypothetical protein
MADQELEELPNSKRMHNSCGNTKTRPGRDGLSPLLKMPYCRLQPDQELMVQNRDKISRLALFAVLAVTAGIFSPTLGFNFNPATDDYHFILFNYLVKDTSAEGLYKILASLNFFKEYQPITFLTYWIDYALYGMQSWGYYLTQIIFHLINVFLVFTLARRLWGSELLGLIAALVFGIHPLQVDTVAMINQRENLLAGTFGLLAMLSYVCWREEHRKWQYSLAFICFCLSLLSEASWVTLPLLLLVLDYARGESLVTPQILDKVPLFLVTAVFSLATMLSQSSSGMATPYHFGSLTSQLMLVCLVYADSFLSFLIPTNLSTAYIYSPMDLYSWHVAVAALILFVIGCALIMAFHKGWRSLFFGLSWFIVLFLPVSQVIPFQIVRADHYMYNCIVGLGIAVGSVAILAVGRRKKSEHAIAAILIITAAYAPLTFMQLEHYSTPFKYINRFVATQGWDSSAASLQARVHQFRKEYDLAAEQYNLAIDHEVEPTRSALRLQLGRVLMSLGRYTEAQQHLDLIQEGTQTLLQAERLKNAIEQRKNSP